ncbi:MAG: AN1-type zinc finger domain-containing protein [Promethearchaeota archaeon]
MSKCYYCNKIIRNLPYRCKFCGMIFCRFHRLPENHNCQFDLIQKSINNKSSKLKLIYQDALEFVSKDLDVAKIYDLFNNKKLTKSKAIELLNFLIENNKDIDVTKNSILAFEVLDLKSEEVFHILENCLLSNENSLIRNTAAKVLSTNFPKKSKSLLKWAKEHNDELKI